MIKNVKERVWAFDLEWIPDPLAGRLLHGIPDSVESPREIMQAMWRAGGASDEDPTPFLKTVLCRIVSIAVVERRAKGEGEEPTLALLSLPRDPRSDDEARRPPLPLTEISPASSQRCTRVRERPGSSARWRITAWSSRRRCTRK